MTPETGWSCRWWYCGGVRGGAVVLGTALDHTSLVRNACEPVPSATEHTSQCCPTAPDHLRMVIRGSSRESSPALIRLVHPVPQQPSGESRSCSCRPSGRPGKVLP